MSLLSDADVQAVTTAMLGVLKQNGAAIVTYAKAEAAKVAQSLQTIAALTASGEIDAEEAALQLDVQKNASQTVLASIAGISEITALQAVDAGLGAVAGVVNRAIGFALIPTV